MDEFALIRRFFDRPIDDESVRLGIGDDAAVVRPPRGDLVVTCDPVVEGVHFDPNAPAALVGRKAANRSLSDLAAMGARPLGFLLSLGLPAGARPGCIEGFLKGLLSAARASGCPLVGGDTVAATEWILSATAVGDVPRGRALRRDRACSPMPARTSTPNTTAMAMSVS